MGVRKGVLEGKLKTYYEDARLSNYRSIFIEAILKYQGKKFDKVLDIGSGIGVFLDSIRPFGYDCYALETSEYGLQRLSEKGINCQSFCLDKSNKLPYESNHFSFVLLNQVIEHLEKEVGKYYIQEIIRVLEPGGVAIIKSPSKYSRIWKTDPHHIYCWKPNELQAEVVRHSALVSGVELQRVPLEPWMMFNYDEKIIDIWHKKNKHPNVKRTFQLIGKIIDVIICKLFRADFMLAVSNVTFTKKI